MCHCMNRLSGDGLCPYGANACLHRVLLGCLITADCKPLEFSIYHRYAKCLSCIDLLLGMHLHLQNLPPKQQNMAAREECYQQDTIK